MENFRVFDGKVILPNGNPLDLIYPTAELIIIGDIAVVRLDVPIDKIYNENVMAIDVGGRLIWKIESRKYVYENSPYMKIVKEEENIAAYNWDGQVLVLVGRTGRIIERRQTK